MIIIPMFISILYIYVLLYQYGYSPLRRTGWSSTHFCASHSSGLFREGWRAETPGEGESAPGDSTAGALAGHFAGHVVGWDLNRELRDWIHYLKIESITIPWKWKIHPIKKRTKHLLLLLYIYKLFCFPFQWRFEWKNRPSTCWVVWASWSRAGNLDTDWVWLIAHGHSSLVIRYQCVYIHIWYTNVAHMYSKKSKKL